MTHHTGGAFADFKSSTYFPNLNGIRFLSISMVLWHHAQPIPWGQIKLADRGFLGVDFFFVLSGFLITTLLLRESERYGQFSIKQFYIRRMLRILPPYFLLILVTTAYYGVVKSEPVGHLLPYYVAFLANFLTEHIPGLEITWSLSVEEQFYLIWPLTLLLVPRRWIPSILVVAITINMVVGAGWIPINGPTFGILKIALPTATYAPILMGSLMAIVLNTKQGFETLNPVLGRKWTSAVMLCALIAILQLVPQNVIGWPNILIHVTMTLTLAAVILNTDNFVSKLLQQPWVMRIGAISYGLYLYHLVGRHIVLVVMGKLGLESDWILLIVYVPISIIFAEISYRTLEAFFLRLKPKRSEAR